MMIRKMPQLGTPRNGVKIPRYRILETRTQEEKTLDGPAEEIADYP